MEAIIHSSDGEYSKVPLFKKNPFEGYLRRLERQHDLDKNKAQINPVLQIVNYYYAVRKWDKMPKEFYKGRHGYPKLAREAKELLTACDGILDDAMWAVSKMEYVANKRGFDWSISTCLKYDLQKA